MPNKYKAGDTAFLIESNRIIREVSIIRVSGSFYTVKFVKDGGGIKVRESRLFATREEAEVTLPKKDQPRSPYYRSPWD